MVRYGPGQQEAARTVAAVYPGAQLREDELLGSTIELSMGVDSPQAVEIPNRLGTTPLPKPTVTATPSTGSDRDHQGTHRRAGHLHLTDSATDSAEGPHDRGRGVLPRRRRRRDLNPRWAMNPNRISSAAP